MQKFFKIIILLLCFNNYAMCQKEINNYNDSFSDSESIQVLNVSSQEFKKFSTGISHLLNLEALIIFEGGWIVFPPDNHPVILDETVNPEIYFPSDISKLLKLKTITIHKLVNQLPVEISDINSLEVLEIMYIDILDFHLEVQKISQIRHLKQLIVHQEYLTKSEMELFKKKFTDVLFLK